MLVKCALINKKNKQTEKPKATKLHPQHLRADVQVSLLSHHFNIVVYFKLIRMLHTLVHFPRYVVHLILELNQPSG